MLAYVLAVCVCDAAFLGEHCNMWRWRATGEGGGERAREREGERERERERERQATASAYTHRGARRVVKRAISRPVPVPDALQRQQARKQRARASLHHPCASINQTLLPH
jgi:hypothetical protein